MTAETGTDPVLLQMVGTLSELKQGQRHTTEQLSQIQADIRTFDVALASIQKDVSQAQHDIAQRTHKEETLRLRGRIECLELDAKTKASSKMMFWVLAMISAMFIGMLAVGIQQVFKP